MNDLFVSLDYNKFTDALQSVQGKLDELIACRHEYPIWPSHGGSPVDAFEEDYHKVIRHQYYQTTIYLLSIVRTLRELS